MTVDEALIEIERITQRGKQHLEESERDKVRAVLDELTAWWNQW